MVIKWLRQTFARNQPERRRLEASFSLLETIVAVSLVAILIVEVSGVHGNSIAFNQYGRKVLQGSYLAKRIMAQVEYQTTFRTPIKDVAGIREKDRPFDDAPEFTYSVSLEPLPNALDLMFKILSGGLVGGNDSEDDENKDSGAGAMLEQMKGLIEKAVGEEPIWIAKVEVSWPEGARRASTELAMILTDIKKVEESVAGLMDVASVSGPTTPTTPPNTGGQPTGGGGTGGATGGGTTVGGTGGATSGGATTGGASPGGPTGGGGEP